MITSELISVVIPTFNRAHLVVEALASVMAQTWRPLDVVVVDDGSTDQTELVVTEWKKLNGDDVNLKFVRQANSGGNTARNLGIKEAQGAFVAFLDSDDIWHREKLEKQMAVMAAHPECSAVYCGVREVNLDDARVLPTTKRTYPEGDILKELLVRDPTAPTSTYLVRKDLIKAAGEFDVSLKARQDWDMWIRLAMYGEIRAVKEPLVDLRQHSGPRTISDPTRELSAHRVILKKYADQRRRLGIVVGLKAKASYHRRAGRVKRHHMRSPFSALGHYFTAVAIWPFAPDSYAAIFGCFIPAGYRRIVRNAWNGVFGKTPFAIRSH